MSNIAFDFLTESMLFNNAYILNGFADFSDKEIKAELRKYREHIQKNFSNILDEVSKNVSETNVSTESFNCLPSEVLLKQLALYMNRVVIPDPIFDETEETDSNLQGAMSRIMGIKPSMNLNREKLTMSAKYMKQSSFLVATEFVKYLPISLLHEAPKDIPIHYSENNFTDALPPELNEFFHKRAKITNIDIVNGYMQFKEDNALRLGTAIHIGFDPDNIRKGVAYQFMHSQMEKFNPNNGKVTLKQYVPDSISKQDFDNWVENSINRAAIKTYTESFNELLFSKQVNCMYLTQSNLTADLLSVILKDNSVKRDIANLSMQLDLPVFQQLPLEEIINIRCNYGEAFHNFRIELGSKLLDLRTTIDPQELKKKLDNLVYELTEVQVNEVNKEYKKIVRSLGIDSAMLTGSLITSFCTGGLTLLGAAGAAAKGMSDYAKYISEVKENNGFFLWKLNRLTK